MASSSLARLSVSDNVSSLFFGGDSHEVEYVSQHTVWNDTGYPISVEPSTEVSNDSDLVKNKLLLAPGERKDLMLEWDLNKMFEASLNENILDKVKIDVWLDHPKNGSACLKDINIQNVGNKQLEVFFNSDNLQFPLICSVSNYKRKKLVRFNSPYIIHNSLSSLLLVSVFNSTLA